MASAYEVGHCIEYPGYHVNLQRHVLNMTSCVFEGLRRITRRSSSLRPSASSGLPTRYTACPRLSSVVKSLARHTAVTYTAPRGHVHRNPAFHETGRQLPKRRSLRRTPKPSGEPSLRWSGDSRLRRSQKAQVGTTRAREAEWNSRDLLPAARAGRDLDADLVSQERGRQYSGIHFEAGP